ncbi:MAG: GNAT family N-acetyltransferase [Rhodospirillales bacterium]|nr:GNAT family N-acetyltransferase [Alphaproteobacteria bacterium]MCB9987085.1 GNAT family N-acetyltransferase [Rhodospirillales bacterium]USO08153.1 MAG: GNAT family N-acetyltransferase [Rhodospirillales bacterium]
MTATAHSPALAPQVKPRFAAAARIEPVAATNHDIGQFIRLHQQVLAALPAHGRHWVKRRLFSDIRNHVRNGNVALGAFDAAGNMIGQLLLTFPDLRGGKNLLGYPVGPGTHAPEHCAIVQTVGLAPGQNGKGVMSALLDAAQMIAAENGRAHLLAKTDLENTDSIRLFKHAGYTPGPETAVAGEAYKCVFMHKPIAAAMFADQPFLKIA